MYYVVKVSTDRGSSEQCYATMEEAKHYFESCIDEQGWNEGVYRGTARRPAAYDTDEDLPDETLLLETKVYLVYTVNLFVCKGAMPKKGKMFL